jgi:hypothetical protein
MSAVTTSSFRRRGSVIGQESDEREAKRVNKLLEGLKGKAPPALVACEILFVLLLSTAVALAAAGLLHHPVPDLALTQCQ